MKMIRHAIAAMGMSAALLAGCSSTPEATQNPAQVEDRTGSTTAPMVPPGAATGQAGSASLSGQPLAPAVTAQSGVSERGDPALRDPRNPLSQRSIYFDYDSFIVGPEFKALIEAHARYLTTNRAVRMRLEGNTDERGSREYNLALGQKRADAVKRALMVLGASEAQVETVSFGEEKPRAAGSSEEAWRENRRSDIFYPGE